MQALLEFGGLFGPQLSHHPGRGSRAGFGTVACRGGRSILRGEVGTVQGLTVEAAMKGDRKLALQALLMDSLVYSMEIEHASQMLDEMLLAQKVWLPRFFN
jgi:hypothetical protein